MRSAIDDGYISDYVINIEYFSNGDRLNALCDMIKNNLSWSLTLIYFNTTEKCKI